MKNLWYIKEHDMMYYSKMEGKKGPVRYLTMGLLMAVFVLGLSAIIMLIWNYVITEITNVKALKYWQAILLFIFFKIIFGGFGPNRHKRRGRMRSKMREKWMNMDDDKRAEFKAKWEEHCNKRSRNKE